MKFCQKCGNKLPDEAAFCEVCGTQSGYAPTQPQYQQAPVPPQNSTASVKALSEKVRIDAIIWTVIGALQVIFGFILMEEIDSEWILIVGVLNIISAIVDFNFSNQLLKKPSGIVARYEPLIGPIITLVYNLIFGGVIGVVGSVYYLLGVRGYVMQNKEYFAAIDAANAEPQQK